MFDLFSNYSWEEFLRVYSLAMMASALLVSVYAVGAVSEPARASSKKF